MTFPNLMISNIVGLFPIPIGVIRAKMNCSDTVTLTLTLPVSDVSSTINLSVLSDSVSLRVFFL